MEARLLDPSDDAFLLAGCVLDTEDTVDGPEPIVGVERAIVASR